MLHNIAVAEYVQGGARDARKLLVTLEALKKRLEEHNAEAEFGEGDAIGDLDPSLTAYNMAVLFYQLKQYARCRSILEDMFSNIEPLDEFLAFKLCFLLLDVYLLQRQAERAGEVLTYLEKSFTLLTKVEGGKENGVDGDGASAAAGGNGDGGSAGAAGGPGSGTNSSAGDWPNKRSARRPPTTITAEEVRGALNMYKAKLALLSRASKSSKREIKTTLNACAPNTTGLFLKCNLEWQRQNFRKAIKLLNNSCQTKGERDRNIPALYFNNLGCIHHCMRRHQSAAFYFSKALQENEALYTKPESTDAGGVALPTFSCDRRCELQYNRGLQLLLCGRPTAAFDAFHVALQLLHSQPRIWLRLGEACVAYHVQQAEEQLQEHGRPSCSPTVAAVGGGSSGSSRYLVLPTDGPTTGPPAEPEAAAATAETGASTGSPAPPTPSLSYGVKCFRNAILQCGNQLGGSQLSSITAADHASLVASAANGTLSSADENTMQLHCVQRLAQLHLSYCALETGDYLPALSWALQVLGLEACPKGLKAYAHLYACDALCHLNRTDEALAQLTAALEFGEGLHPVASNSGAEPAAVDGDGLDCVRNPYSPLRAGGGGAGGRGGVATGGGRAALYTNLAVVHVLQGKAEQAENYVAQALSEQPDCRAALLCNVYLALRSGHTDAAIDLLKKQRRAK